MPVTFQEVCPNIYDFKGGGVVLDVKFCSTGK